MGGCGFVLLKASVWGCGLEGLYVEYLGGGWDHFMGKWDCYLRDSEHIFWGGGNIFNSS